MQKNSFFKGGLLRIDFTSTINDFSFFSKYSKEITVRDAYSFVLGHYETNTRRLKVSFRQSTHENATRCRNFFLLPYVIEKINDNRKCYWPRIHISFFYTYVVVWKDFLLIASANWTYVCVMIIYRILLGFIQLIEYFRRLSLLHLISSFVESQLSNIEIASF